MKLEEIRARWEKVTPGSWRANYPTHSHWHGGKRGYGADIYVGGPVFRWLGTALGDAGRDALWADAEAIAHAPEDIKRLLRIAEAAGKSLVAWNLYASGDFKGTEDQAFSAVLGTMRGLDAALSDKEEG